MKINQEDCLIILENQIPSERETLVTFLMAENHHLQPGQPLIFRGGEAFRGTDDAINQSNTETVLKFMIALLLEGFFVLRIIDLI